MQDFNSRPSARGDVYLNSQFMHQAISIHAPPRGATPVLPALFIPEIISIHAPPRGATIGYSYTLLKIKISIHAPPRGATIPDFRIVKFRTHFNSRPSARGDGIRCCHPIQAIYFNSRPSARGDRRMPHLFQIFQAFQFTPLREGRRWTPNVAF